MIERSGCGKGNTNVILILVAAPAVLLCATLQQGGRWLFGHRAAVSRGFLCDIAESLQDRFQGWFLSSFSAFLQGKLVPIFVHNGSFL